MSLNDVVGSTLLRVRMDTSQAKAEIRSLRGAEKQAAIERLAESEKQQKAMDASIANWTKVGVVVGGMVATYKLAQVAAHAYLEDVRLESAAAGLNIDKLKTATMGLVEADKLMAFAGKASHGVWKLNQEEMERVLHGAMALRKTMGVELQPTVDALTESIAKGSTRALKEFGIAAQDKQGALRELDKAWMSIGGNAKMAGDNFLKAEVSLTDSFDDLKEAFGQLAVSMAPVLEAFAGLIGFTAQTIGLIGDLAAGVKEALAPQDQYLLRGLPSAPGESGNAIRLRELMADRSRAGASLAGAQRSLASIGGRTDYMSQQQAQIAQSTIDQMQAVAAKLDTEIAALEADIKAKEREAGELGIKAGKALFDQVYGSTVQSFYHSLKGKKTLVNIPGGGRVGGGFGGKGPELVDQLEGMGFRDQPDYFADLIGGWNKESAEAKVYAELHKRMPTFSKEAFSASIGMSDTDKDLTKIFGPQHIDAVKESVLLLGDAFGALQAASGAAYDELIKGSGDAMAAFQKVIAGGIAAMGKEMFIKGISESAWGIADLARGNFPGAAVHGKAAAAFFAGSAVAGVTAHALGYGASPGGAAPSAGGQAARTISNRSASDQDNRPVNVYVGSEWAALSKIEQANAINRAIRLGKRGSNTIRRS